LSAQVTQSALCRTLLREVVSEEETEDLLQLLDGRVFECRSRPQYLGERIVGRVFSYTDITERQRAEAALRESRDQLEARVLSRTADLQRANATLETEKARQQELIHKLNEAQNQLLQSEKMASIGVLAAGVAHEINNPISFVNSNLNALQQYARDMLRLLDEYEAGEAALAPERLATIARLKQEIDADFLREDLGSLLDESREGLERVMRIVQDLKYFSHVDSSGLVLANLEQGLDSTLNVVWNEIKYKAEVVKEYGGIAQITCFPSQLNQVFMNLLVNAAHAIEDKGRITVRTGSDDAHVWVEIEDSGKGIPPEHRDRIFEPFFTTKPVGKGTGLGLSLSYGIVQKHGGHIEVHSEVGKGSVFRVVLPLVRAAEPEDVATV
ncbi:MAG: ATP-binding protein, partial [Pseudomonadota bacterium]